MSPPRAPQSPHDAVAGSHPTADELVSHANGELAPEPSARLKRHLEGCSECREVVRDLAAFPALEPPGEAYRIGPEELRSSLGELRVRALAEEIGALDSGIDPERPSTPSQPDAAPRADRGRLLRFPAARWLPQAAMVVALLGWGLYGRFEVEDLKDELEDARSRLAATAAALTRPLANAGVAQLPELGNPLRGPSSGLSLQPAGLTVVLDPDDPLPPGRYSAEIRTASGTLVHQIEELEPQPLGLSFYLPPGGLPPGEYTVRVRGDDGAEWPTVWRLALQQ